MKKYGFEVHFKTGEVLITSKVNFKSLHHAEKYAEALASNPDATSVDVLTNTWGKVSTIV